LASAAHPRGATPPVGCWGDLPKPNTKAEQDEIDVAIVRGADAVEVWVREGMSVSMNRYN